MSEWRPEDDPESHGRGIDQEQPPSQAGGPQPDDGHASYPHGQSPQQAGNSQPAQTPGLPQHAPWELPQAYGQRDYLRTSQPDAPPPLQVGNWQTEQLYGPPPRDPWAASQAHGRHDDRQAPQPDGQSPRPADTKPELFTQQPYPSQQPYGQQHRRPPAGRLGKGKLAALAAGGIAALLIMVSVVMQAGKGAPSGASSPTASIAAHEVSTASKGSTPTTARMPTAAATSAGAAASTAPAPPNSPPSSKVAGTTPAAAAPSPPPSSPVAPTTSAAASPTPSATATGCQSQNGTGTCFAVGQSCPAADHGQSAQDSQGNAIICENNHGWHWVSSNA